MSVAVLIYGVLAISIAVLVPVRGSIEVDGAEPHPLWPGTVLVIRTLGGLLWPVVVVAGVVAWRRKRMQR